MKIVVQGSLAYSDIAPFIRNLNIPFISGSGNEIIVGPEDGNHVSVSWSYQYSYLSVNGGSSVNPWRVNDRQTITAIYNDSFLSFQLTDGSRRGIFIYEKIDDNLAIYGYAGTAWNQSHGFYNIEEVTCYDFSSRIHSYSKILNYAAPSGYIDRTGNSIFKGGYKFCDDINTIACSTITSNQTIIIDNKKYFAIGTNTLVEKDEEAAA